MFDDPIVAEIRKIRDEHAKKFNYDLDAIFEDYQRIGKESGREHVSYPVRRVEPSEAPAKRKRKVKRAKA